MHVDILIPDIAEGVTEATIVRWHKAVGATVKAGEPLLDIMTDKVGIEIECPKDGVLVEVLHGAEEELKIGTVIGRIET